MQCLVVRELLSPYLDGVLSLAEQKEISAHLAVCPSCRAEFEILCDLVNILKDLPELSPSSGFSARVIKNVAALPPEKRQGRFPKFLRDFTRGAWTRVEALAAALVFAFGITMLMYGMPWQRETGREIPQILVDQGQGEQEPVRSGRDQELVAVNPDYELNGNSGPETQHYPDQAAITGDGTAQGGSAQTGAMVGVVTPASQPERSSFPVGQNINAERANMPAVNQDNSFTDTSRGLNVSRVVAVKEGVISKKVAYGNVPPSSRESEQKIIQNATLRLDGDGNVRSELESLAGSKGIQMAGYTDEGGMLMKVPAGQYETVVTSMQNLGKLTIGETNREDISNEYTAYEVRLKELAVQEQILLEAIEKYGNAPAPDITIQLEKVREDMEYCKKQLLTLSSQVEYAFIQINLE